MKHLMAALLIGAVQVGCASVPMGDPQRDATLKTFAVQLDQAGLFIYRDQNDAMPVATYVQLDGTPLGQTAAMTYLHTPVAPGRHLISSSADNTDTLEVDIRAGGLVYIRQEIEVWADSPQVRLYLMREEEGRSGVRECRLALGKSMIQVVEVLVEADDPAWEGPLDCRASNSFGIWQFTAPGTVSVQPAVAPLHIDCNVPAGSELSATATIPSGDQTRESGAREGAATGAKVGAGAGVALGVAAAPVMGPVFAVLLAAGSALQGAELGGVIGTLKTGDLTADDSLLYPSPITVHIGPLAESN